MDTLRCTHDECLCSGCKNPRRRPRAVLREDQVDWRAVCRVLHAHPLLDELLLGQHDLTIGHNVSRELELLHRGASVEVVRRRGGMR